MKYLLSPIIICSAASLLLACNDDKAEAYHWTSPKYIEFYDHEVSFALENGKPGMANKMTSHCELYTHDHRGQIVSSTQIFNYMDEQDFSCAITQESAVSTTTKSGQFHYDGDWVSSVDEHGCTLQRINQYGNPEVVISTKNSRDDGSCLYENWYDAQSYVINTYDEGIYLTGSKQYTHPGADLNWDTPEDNIEIDLLDTPEHSWSDDRTVHTVTTSRETLHEDNTLASGKLSIREMRYKDGLAEQKESIKDIAIDFYAYYDWYYDEAADEYVTIPVLEVYLDRQETHFVYENDTLVREDFYFDTITITIVVIDKDTMEAEALKLLQQENSLVHQPESLYSSKFY